MATQSEIGKALLYLPYQLKGTMLFTVSEYRVADARFKVDAIKSAVNAPHLAQAKIQNWVNGYNSRNGPGTAGPYLDSCLTAYGSTTTASDINTEVAALVSQMQGIVDNVNNLGWTWDQVADYIDANIVATPPEQQETFSYSQLVTPDGYISVWGDA